MTARVPSQPVGPGPMLRGKRRASCRRAFGSAPRFLPWLLLLAFHQVRAGDDPAALLHRMNQALSMLDYDGISTYVQGDDVAVLRLAHSSDRGVPREHLVHLNGPPREIRRLGDRVLCVMRRGDEILELARSVPAGPFVRAFTPSLDRVPAHYRLAAGRMDRVAGRTARELVVRPRQDDRYGYRLWLDDETGLLLRYELLDMRVGRRLEIFQFTQLVTGAAVAPLEFEPIADADMVVIELFLAEGAAAAGAAAVAAAGGAAVDQGAARSPGWQPGWLPPGFELAAQDRRTVPRSLRDVSTRMYSDGLASFSVFVEPAGSQHPTRDLQRRRGGTVAISRAVRDESISALVTVVGEIPAHTAERIARRIRFDR